MILNHLCCVKNLNFQLPFLLCTPTQLKREWFDTFLCYVFYLLYSLSLSLSSLSLLFDFHSSHSPSILVLPCNFNLSISFHFIFSFHSNKSVSTNIFFFSSSPPQNGSRFASFSYSSNSIGILFCEVILGRQWCSLCITFVRKIRLSIGSWG